MVTYFNRKDMISFGAYLVSEKRRRLIQQAHDTEKAYSEKEPISVEERFSQVYHADFENWMNEKKGVLNAD